MATLKNHPGYWLRDDAAAAFDYMESQEGRISVNSAGRTVSEQNHLIWRWDKGGASNRPPYLYAPARPATASLHVKNGGEAFDTSEHRRVAQFAHKYGFVQPYPKSDPVHFEYRGSFVAPESQVKDATPVGGHFVRINDYPFATYRVSAGEKPSTTAAMWGMSLSRYYRLNGIDPNVGFKRYPVGLSVRVAYDHRVMSKRLLRPGSEGYDVARVQEHLRRVYPLYASKLVIDGIYGTATIAAVKEFQRRSGLVPDGKVGDKTWAKLGM